MHENETRALRRGAMLLMVISLARWGLESRRSDQPPPQGQDVLGELLEASREAEREEARRSSPLRETERIDPNRAGEVELDRLPGIGPSTARAIVSARDSGAVFRSPEDLLAVRGIGPRTLERFRDLLTLPEAPRLPRSGTAARAAVSASEPVDVNRAGSEALQGLPGIGPALAGRIVSARLERPFTSVDDLTRVRGIGPSTLERLRPRVIVSGGR